MTVEGVVSIAAAAVTIGGSILYGAFRVGSRVQCVTDSVDKATEGIGKVEGRVVEMKDEMRTMDETHRADQAKQWDQLTDHERRIGQQDVKLAEQDGKITGIESKLNTNK